MIQLNQLEKMHLMFILKPKYYKRDPVKIGPAVEYQTCSCYPNWIVTEGQKSGGLQIRGWINCWHSPRPNRTLTTPILHTRTHTDIHTLSQLHSGLDRHFDLCLATNKKREQNQLAITALSTRLSPPGSRVLKIKDRVHTTCLYHSIYSFPLGRQISAQSPYTQSPNWLSVTLVLRGSSSLEVRETGLRLKCRWLKLSDRLEICGWRKQQPPQHPWARLQLPSGQ